MCTVSSKPKVHKHFIIEDSTFKMTSIDKKPTDNQSTSLFKLGERKYKTGKTTEITSSTANTYQRTTSQIIPSSAFGSIGNRETQITQNSQTYSTTNDTTMYTPHQHNIMAEAEKLQKEGKLTEEQFEEKMVDLLINTLNSNSSNNNSGQQEAKKPNQSACPICDRARNPQLYQEELAWNKWRSDIQNRLMDDSTVNGNYGDWFLFSFDVDKFGYVSKIHVYSSNHDKFSEVSIRSAIKRLNHDKILEFPKGTKRTSTVVEGGFVIDDHVQYSSPGDFSDYESVQYYK